LNWRRLSPACESAPSGADAAARQGAQIEQFLAGPATCRKAFFHQQLQHQLGVTSIMLLLARFRTNLSPRPRPGETRNSQKKVPA
jgi:hypothetical protein